MPSEVIQMTTDNYADFAIENDQIVGVSWDVSAPYPALYQLAQYDKANSISFSGNDQTARPGSGGYSGCKGVQFKSKDPNTPTVVALTVYYADDPAPTGFSDSTTTFDDTGANVETQDAGSVDVSTIGTQDVIVIPKQRTFLLYLIVLTYTVNADPSTGGSWQCIVELENGFDGESSAVTIAQDNVIYAQNSVVNIAPLVIPTSIPVQGGSAGNKVQAVTSQFGTAPQVKKGTLVVLGSLT